MRSIYLIVGLFGALIGAFLGWKPALMTIMVGSFLIGPSRAI